MVTNWLKSGLQKVAVFSKHGADEDLEFSSIEFRAICNHLELNRDGLASAAEDVGLSKVAAVAILAEKLGFDPLTAMLVGGGGAAAAKLYPKIRPYGRALAQKILPRNAKRDIAVENIMKMMRGMPKETQNKVLSEVANTAKAGPAFGRSPLTWGRKDFAKALGLGGGAAGLGYIGAKVQDSKKQRGGNKVVIV